MPVRDWRPNPNRLAQKAEKHLNESHGPTTSKLEKKDFHVSNAISLYICKPAGHFPDGAQEDNPSLILAEVSKSAARFITRLILVSLLISFCLTSAAAQNCKAIFPAGNGQDDAATINDCLQRKGVAKLKPGTFLLYSPIVFPRKTPEIAVSGIRLIGKGKDATRLVAQSTCSAPWDVGTERTYQPAIQIIKSPEAVISGFELDISNLRQDCNYYGNYMIFVSKSPKSQVSGLRVKGSRFGVIGETYTTGGANSGGILVSNSDDTVVSDNEIKDVGFTFENGILSAGNGGISIASSANNQVLNNRVERVAFGIIVSNGSAREGYYGDSSGTIVSGNTVIGAANIRCANCSQGRGLKFQACYYGDELPLRNLTVSNNVVTEFGGHNSTIGGSGIDLVCGVQYSTFDNNRVVGAPNAEFSLQIRSSYFEIPPNPSHHNKFQFNTFISGRGSPDCLDDCVDVNFTRDGPDQIGIRRNGADYKGTNNTTSFRAETDRGCEDYAHPYFLYLDGRNFVRHGERILLTALGVRPNSPVNFSFTRAADGTEVLAHRSASVNRYCIMNQEYISIDALKFPAGEYKIFAEYKDGNSNAVISKDEIGTVVVKPAKGN
jgi:hypothetical protein